MVRVNSNPNLKTHAHFTVADESYVSELHNSGLGAGEIAKRIGFSEDAVRHHLNGQVKARRSYRPHRGVRSRLSSGRTWVMSKPGERETVKMLAAEGKSIGEIARIAGRSKTTVYGWLHPTEKSLAIKESTSVIAQHPREPDLMSISGAIAKMHARILEVESLNKILLEESKLYTEDNEKREKRIKELEAQLVAKSQAGVMTSETAAIIERYK